MKRTITFLMLVLLTLGGAMATPVGSQRARQTAETFWQAQGLKGALTEQATEFTHLHLFVGEEGGFVVVSGDDCARPVLAWSADAPTADTLHPAMRYWLDGYDCQIARAVALGAQTSPEWRSPKSVGTLTTVGPLLTTHWGQDTLYNDQCPTVSGEHCYTGCVATATAQVMKYHNHPTTGHGSHSYTNHGTQSANFGTTTYVWSQMPDRLNSSSTTAQVAAVAQLMYHIGVAVEMSYSTSGSSTATTDSYGYFDVCAENALKQYFGYSNGVRSLSRGAYSQQEWVNVIEAEIDAQRPIIYSGRGLTAGHTFVCDGYDNHHRLHINWGWKELYDGWFYNDALWFEYGTAFTIGSNADDDYRMGQTIIVGIEPSTATPASSYSVTVSASTGGTVSGGGTYNAGASATLSATEANGYRFDRWSDGVGWNPRTLPVYGNMSLTAQFVPITGNDTLQLDNGVSMFYTSASASATFPANLMAGHQRLTAVMYYPNNAGSHTVTVNYGNNQTYTKSEVPLTPGLWNTLYLDVNIPLSTSNAVTVTITPAQGTIVSMVGGAPIRLICDGMVSPHRLEVNSGRPDYGYVIGSGYYAGNPATATITAVPLDTTDSFMWWTDGDTSNPRVVQLTSDSSFTAWFKGNGTFYLITSSNDTTLGTVNAPEDGWHDRRFECPINLEDGCYFAQANPTPAARFDHWNCDTAGINFHLYLPTLVTVETVVHDTVNLEAVFVPVLNNDTLRYDDYHVTAPAYLYDTSTHFRWGVKYDPSALAGVDRLSQIIAYLGYDWGTNGNELPCDYTIQVYQGGDNSPQTLIGSKVIPTAHLTNYGIYDGNKWRHATFYPPLAIDSTQPVWVVVSCNYTGRAGQSAMKGGHNFGNPNSDYVWTALTGWTNYTAREGFMDYYFRPDWSERPRSWNIRAYTGNNAKADITTKVIFHDNNGNDWSYGGTVSGDGERFVGSTASLTAVPDNGLMFDHWDWFSAEDQNVSGTSTDNPVSFTVTGDVYYIAHFVPRSRVHVSWSTNGLGDISYGSNYVDNVNTYYEGTTVTLTAVPFTNTTPPYEFARWEWHYDSDPTTVYQSTDNPVSFTATEDVTYTAYFVQPVTVATEKSPSYAGQVTGGGSYLPGETVTLRANPNSNYTFDHWEWNYWGEYYNGDHQSTANPVTFTATHSVTYKAVFTSSTQTVHITVHSNNNAWGTVSGGGTYQTGQTAVLTATPKSGYHFLYWKYDNTDMEIEENPFYLTIQAGMSGNYSLTGYFAEGAGIGDITEDGIILYSRDGQIVVEGSTDEVRVFDIVGRLVATATGENIAIRVPCVGVYMVKTGTHPARKIVVIR